MAEASFKQMITTLLRQTRPQSFRHSKPPRYPQRSLSTAANPQPPRPAAEGSRWQAHTIQTPSLGTAQTERPRLESLRNESEPRTFSSFLTDNYSRQHNYLRISVTERCNLRCLYCMPEEGIQLSPSARLLTTPEIVYLSELFVNQGVDKIRLTGGEPTVRKDIVDLMHQIGKLRSNGLKELCITTNGISLHRKLDSMVESGLTGVNLSLDTLDPYQFTIMTRRNGHDAVMKSINRILEMNKLGAAIKLKINCVVMRGLNEREILPFVELGRNQDLEVRFIEYMPFDGNKWSEKKMLGFREMLALIRQKYPDVQKVRDHKNDTSKTYKVPGFAGRIGFITSMTHNFCGTCNRLRITSDGNLKVCLFGNTEVSLRDILRESNDGNPIDAEAMEAIREVEMDRRERLSGAEAVVMSEKEARLLDVIGMAVKRKKEKHAGIGELENMKNRPMILIDDAVLKQSLPASSSPAFLSRYADSMTALHRSSIPMHLLQQPTLSPSWSQIRYFSSLLATKPAGFREFSNTTSLARLRHKPFRYVHGQSAYRRVPTKEPENIPAHSFRCWDESRQRSLRSKTSRARSKTQSYGQYLIRDIMKRVYHHQSPRSERSKSGSPGWWRENAPSKQSSETERGESQTTTSTDTSLAHLTADGEAHMVSIANKKPTSRSATATTLLLFSHYGTYGVLFASRLRKGDALAVARIAGIQAAKKTSDLIPLAHPGLNITGATVRLEPFMADKLPYPLSEGKGDIGIPHDMERLYGGVFVTATVTCEGKTGVEMEAITAASVAGLTMYDMLKGVDKEMVLTATRVTAKSGGKSGDWEWDYKLGQRVFPNNFSREGSSDRSSSSNGADNTVIATAEQQEVQRGVEEQDRLLKQQRIQQAIHQRRDESSTRGQISADDLADLRTRRLRRQLHATRSVNTAMGSIGAEHSPDK
ncbi:molybdenum cofactor biosynthesis protein A [Fonsecaea erecta]|uniref:Molybdenum cofactor biosynthesis protein A n=1 Tax=Fonsecaea erecta TaxID=1367422 RepID=A0A178ZX24_9EURO|nr:molybdenum cofactor biosynthesis protein A [Fonsecaea erecta]OAP64380.1 molybdenum cofactor biosynthesis protein A [Fonsecaea erecta]